MMRGGTQARMSVCFSVLVASSLACAADTVLLKSGKILRTTIERFSDGAFWIKDGGKTVIVYPDEISKIVFDIDPPKKSLTPPPATRPAADTPAAPTPAAARPNDHGWSGAARPNDHGGPVISGGIPAASADAANAPDTPPQGLVILNYDAVLTRGIFQVVGEVQNFTDAEARYVKLTVILQDAAGEVIDQNFSYLLGKNPHLLPMEKKSFRVSFLNPPDRVAKYKIRVETSEF